MHAVVPERGSVTRSKFEGSRGLNWFVCLPLVPVGAREPTMCNLRPWSFSNPRGKINRRSDGLARVWCHEHKLRIAADNQRSTGVQWCKMALVMTVAAANMLP